METKLPWNRQLLLLCAIGTTLFSTSSCVDTKKAVYFNDIKEASIEINLAEVEAVIQKSDLLSISVTSLSPEATVIFNMPNSSPGNLEGSGYLVDQDGYLLFPILGNIRAVGLTKKQLTQQIRSSLVEKKLLIDPIVNIRFLNFRVTVLGEVAKPGVIMVANEKISLLEAIGLAGDLTIYGKRDNVMVIREENGKKTIKRLSLNSSDIFNSPYYYLQSNDIVYAEPNRVRVATSQNSQQLVPILFSAISLMVIIIDRIIR
jgi:polysaccharide export outer membrane protein